MMSDLKAQRKSQIIRSAIEVFGENGFYKGRVEDIAINAGIGKGTIYEYFKSKDEIFQEMLKYMFREYIEAIKSSARGKTTAKDKIIAILDLKWEFIMKYEDTMKQNFLKFGNMTESIRPFIIDTHRSVYDLILDIVKKGMETGEIKKDLDPKNLTILLLSTMNSGGLNRIIFQSKEMDSRAIIDMVFDGISN
jgi:AcrR family transcriptional regulator